MKTTTNKPPYERKDKVFSASMHPDILDMLDILCMRLNVSRSAYLRNLIMKDFEEKVKKPLQEMQSAQTKGTTSEE